MGKIIYVIYGKNILVNEHDIQTVIFSNWCAVHGLQVCHGCLGIILYISRAIGEREPLASSVVCLVKKKNDNGPGEF